MSANALRHRPLSLRLTSTGFLILWCVIAAFPILWIAIMSFKAPIDAFDRNVFNVILGPKTLQNGHGVSIFEILLTAGFIYITLKFILKRLPGIIHSRFSYRWKWFGWAIATAAVSAGFVICLWWVLPHIGNALNPFLGPLGHDVLGFTTQYYKIVWLDRGLINNFQNSLIVTLGVVAISLTFGTLAGYGLARSGSGLAFWILIIALIFRALPHSVLVAGYLPVFINSAEILSPILGDAAPTLYGKPLAVIAVLVAINQPFTIWMLRSFFLNVPVDLDEAARVDGCSHFQAFRQVIMPIMWPGVITTGLFSFLLAYNDLLVTSLLLDASNQTMVPAIAGFFNRETTTTDQIVAVAGAVSITAPLFLLVIFFQKQIVSGLTAGAVKG